jgi:hypothetical protein
MSQWTHVNGNIRIDSFGFLFQDKKLNSAKHQIERILGPMSTWEEPNDKCTLPIGSEGSIEYQTYTNSSENAMARYSVQFWGDLRNYDNFKEILKWFKDICKKFEKDKDNLTCIRNAVLYVDIEFKENYIIYWNNNKRKVEYICIEEGGRIK